MKKVSYLTESFWLFLYPISVLWAFLTRLRRWVHPKQKVIKQRNIICIGNIHAGGSGKTPVTLEIAKHFQKKKPCIVSRGYRALTDNIGVEVDLSVEGGAYFFGDEPWLMAQQKIAPVWIGNDRYKTISKIDTHYALIVLDDGFQNLQFKHDVDLVLIQTGRFPSESFTFPLGLLRESFSSLEKASAVLLLEGENLQSWQNLILEFYPSIPLFTAKREYFGFWNEKGQQTIQGDMGAFCGIAFPPAFLKAVAERGSLKYHKAFPDHFSYDVATVSKLIEEGKRRNIQKWITTEKDWFKVGPLFEKLGMMEDLSFLKSGIKLQDSFWEFLREHIND